MHLDARHYESDEVLRDGGLVHVRAIRPDDKQRLLDLFHQLSARSVYFRFFRTKDWLTDEELRYFTELDFVRNVALVATLHVDDDERIIAVGCYFGLGPTDEPCTRAEMAFTVDDAHQGRGLGTLLLVARSFRQYGIALVRPIEQRVANADHRFGRRADLGNAPQGRQ